MNTSDDAVGHPDRAEVGRSPDETSPAGDLGAIVQVVDLGVVPASQDEADQRLALLPALNAGLDDAVSSASLQESDHVLVVSFIRHREGLREEESRTGRNR